MVFSFAKVVVLQVLEGQSALTVHDLFALTPPLQVGRNWSFWSFRGVVHVGQMLRARMLADVTFRLNEQLLPIVFCWR